MKIVRILLAATLLTISTADFVFAKSYVDRKSEEKIAIIFGVSIVLAGLAIGGGIYLSKRKNTKKEDENTDKG